MLKRPAPALAGAALLLQRERRVKLKQDRYLIRGSVGAEAVFFLPILQRIKKKKKLDSYQILGPVLTRYAIEKYFY